MRSNGTIALFFNLTEMGYSHHQTTPSLGKCKCRVVVSGIRCK
ncbi:hypothetical protein I552_9821 [Mycobacterium xenopi 3993]|nr:hypothetical protein I552_9821 [Mycobacterium xenopi 3993]